VSLDQVQEQLQIWQVSGIAETSNGIRKWIGLRENLPENHGKTIDVSMKIMGFSCKFSLKAIH
jgi:hypothetical protein